ncbi:MAG: NUDIX hydrolase [Bacteroidetes bacterium]|nr:NUDIX hydrolase [Bacteroidota bacterium]
MAESREYPTRPFVAVGGIVLKGDEVLLIQRGKAPSYGRWSIPGGAVELGETLQEALVREVCEECGIEVEVGPVAEVIDRIVRDDDGQVHYHYVILDFAARYLRGELQANSDAAGARWVPLSAIGEYELAPQTVAVIQKAARMLAEAGPPERADVTRF